MLPRPICQHLNRRQIRRSSLSCAQQVVLPGNHRGNRRGSRSLDRHRNLVVNLLPDPPLNRLRPLRVFLRCNRLVDLVGNHPDSRPVTPRTNRLLVPPDSPPLSLLVGRRGSRRHVLPNSPSPVRVLSQLIPLLLRQRLVHRPFRPASQLRYQRQARRRSHLPIRQRNLPRNHRGNLLASHPDSLPDSLRVSHLDAPLVSPRLILRLDRLVSQLLTRLPTRRIDRPLTPHCRRPEAAFRPQKQR